MNSSSSFAEHGIIAMDTWKKCQFIHRLPRWQKISDCKQI